MLYKQVPIEFFEEVKNLPFENDSDRKEVLRALQKPSEITQSTLNWFKALIERKGARFDANNKDHATPHNYQV